MQLQIWHSRQSRHAAGDDAPRDARDAPARDARDAAPRHDAAAPGDDAPRDAAAAARDLVERFDSAKS